MDSHSNPVLLPGLTRAFLRVCPQHLNHGEVRHDPRDFNAGPPGSSCRNRM